MPKKVIRIERLKPRGGIAEYPTYTCKGYELAPPSNKVKQQNCVENSVYVRSLDDAAHLIEKAGYSIRMGREGKRASLICPRSIRIVRS